MEVGARDKDKNLDIGQVRRGDIYVQCTLVKSFIGKKRQFFLLKNIKKKQSFIGEGFDGNLTFRAVGLPVGLYLLPSSAGRSFSADGVVSCCFLVQQNTFRMHFINTTFQFKGLWYWVIFQVSRLHMQSLVLSDPSSVKYGLHMGWVLDQIHLLLLYFHHLCVTAALACISSRPSLQIKGFVPGQVYTVYRIPQKKRQKEFISQRKQMTQGIQVPSINMNKFYMNSV